MKQLHKLAFTLFFAALIGFCSTAVVRAQDNESYPKPDFKEIEKWYEVVKFEYDILKTKVYLTVKPKRDESRPTHWRLDYRDADGVSIFEQGFYIKDGVKAGEPYRADAFTLTETQMEKVKSVTLTRVKS